MPDDEQPGFTPDFVQRLTAAQSALYAFIAGLLGGVEHANDVLQETNLKLCRRARDYDDSQPFLRWAYAFARFEVMAWRKRQTRSRLVLDDDLVACVAQDFEDDVDVAERQLVALEHCSEKLPAIQRELVTARYRDGEPVQVIALRLARPENVVSALLYRIRKALADCMESSLTREEST